MQAAGVFLKGAFGKPSALMASGPCCGQAEVAPSLSLDRAELKEALLPFWQHGAAQSRQWVGSSHSRCQVVARSKEKLQGNY